MFARVYELMEQGKTMEEAAAEVAAPMRQMILDLLRQGKAKKQGEND